MAEKTIVCIHGLGASKGFFSTLAQTSLAQNNRIIAVDLPGFGDRWTDPVGDLPITSAAEALASEVDKMGCQNVVLVGHSLGGAAALLTATMVSGQVWGLASLEGNLVAEDCGMSRRLAVAANLTECASIKTKAIDEAKHSENPGVRDWARDLSKVSPSTLLSYSRELVALSDGGELLRQFLTGRYRRIYLHGDDYVGHPVLDRLGSIQVEYIKGASHTNLVGDAPEACAQALSQILSQTVDVHGRRPA